MSPEHVAPMIAMLAIFFGIFIAVLWIVLPFAVFGIKPLLRDILDELRNVKQP